MIYLHEANRNNFSPKNYNPCEYGMFDVFISAFKKDVCSLWDIKLLFINAICILSLV